jgi:hypothetical protein
LLTGLCYSGFSVFAQSPDLLHSVIYVYSVYTSVARVKAYKPETIAALAIVKRKTFDSVDRKTKDNTMYVFTKAYVRKYYWALFSSYSKEYKKQVRSPASYSDVRYILNNKLLSKKEESQFWEIVNNHSLQGIQIINRDLLLKKYKIRNRRIGIIIQAGQKALQ